MTYKGPWPGTWAVICDVCGFRFPSSKVKKRWDGLIVCDKDFEYRHPQDFLRLKEEHITPPFVRPPPADAFIFVCDEYSRQGLADVGTADCAQVNYINPNL